MKLWEEGEFERIAIRTKLSDRTLLGCRKVLVDGLEGIVAAKETSLAAPQISRGLKILKEKQQEMVKEAMTILQEGNFIKQVVVELAKAIAGEGFEIKDAEAGKKYDGPIILNKNGFVVQRVGRESILHDLGKLQSIPVPGNKVSIDYSASGKKASVAEEKAAPLRRVSDLER